MTLAGQVCPCGSTRPYAACCGPLLAGEPAHTAEALMRSRYTAYVLGDEDHIFRTWHPRTRPASTQDFSAAQWVGLQVLQVVAGGPDDEAGEVEFVARFQPPGGVIEAMHERSSFARRGGRWLYVDGVQL